MIPSIIFSVVHPTLRSEFFSKTSSEGSPPISETTAVKLLHLFKIDCMIKFSAHISFSEAEVRFQLSLVPWVSRSHDQICNKVYHMKTSGIPQIPSTFVSHEWLGLDTILIWRVQYVFKTLNIKGSMFSSANTLYLMYTRPSTMGKVARMGVSSQETWTAGGSNAAKNVYNLHKRRASRCACGGITEAAAIKPYSEPKFRAKSTGLLLWIKALRRLPIFTY